MGRKDIFNEKIVPTLWLNTYANFLYFGLSIMQILMRIVVANSMPPTCDVQWVFGERDSVCRGDGYKLVDALCRVHIIIYQRYRYVDVNRPMTHNYHQSYLCIRFSAVPVGRRLGGEEDSAVTLLIRGRHRQPETRYFQSLIRNENNIWHDERARTRAIPVKTQRYGTAIHVHRRFIFCFFFLIEYHSVGDHWP